MTDRLTLLRPDDWHIHLRDGAVLKHTVADAARMFSRAIIMPNLVPPARNITEAGEYRQRILDAVPAGSSFEPLMTLYLTDQTLSEDIRAAKASGFVHAAKLYPAGATTNSDSGVTVLEHIYPALATMAEVGMPLLVHGEVTHDEVDIFDREKRFIDDQLISLVGRFPGLKVVMEHITTADAVQFVESAGSNIAATITPHHLLFNRNHMLVGGIKPHFYCLPVLKRNTHQLALLAAATSGSPKFFWAPILRRMRNTPRKQPVAVPAATVRLPPLSCMQQLLSKKAHWTSWKALPATLGQTFTVCRETAKQSLWCAPLGRCRTGCPSVTARWCPCVLAKHYSGACWRTRHDSRVHWLR